jgi:hypothetical protein
VQDSNLHPPRERQPPYHWTKRAVDVGRCPTERGALGQESHPTCQSASVTSTCRPRRRHVDGDRSFGRDMTTTRPSLPFVGDLFSCQGAIWARRTKAFVQIVVTLARRRKIPFLRRGKRAARCQCSAPSRALSLVLRSLRKSKKPLPCGSGSSGQGPMKVHFRPSRTPPWEGTRRTLLGRRQRPM